MKITNIAAILIATGASTASANDGAFLRGGSGPNFVCKDYPELSDPQSCLKFCSETVKPTMRGRANGNGKGGLLRCMCWHNDEVVFDCKNPRAEEEEGETTVEMITIVE